MVELKESSTRELTNHTVQKEYSSPGNHSLTNAVKSGNETNREAEDDDDESDPFDRLSCNCVQTLQGGGGVIG